jgi:hypothetical protein
VVGTGPVLGGAVVAVSVGWVGWPGGAVVAGSPGVVVTAAVDPVAAEDVVGVDVVCVDPQPARTTTDPARSHVQRFIHPPISQLTADRLTARSVDAHRGGLVPDKR